MNLKLNKIDQSIIWRLPLLVILSVLVGFRDVSVGSDTLAYINKFSNFANGVNGLTVDYGFIFLARISYIVSDDVRWFFSVIALLISYLMIRAADNSTYTGRARSQLQKFVFDLVFFSLILISSWYITSVTNGLRQGLQLAFTYYALCHYQRFQRPLIFALIMVAGSSFHFTAVLLTPFLIFLFVSEKKLWFVWCVSVVLYPSGIGEILVKELSSLFGLGFYESISTYGVIKGEDVSKWRGFQLDFYIYTVFWALLAKSLINFDIIRGVRGIRNTLSLERSLKIYLILTLPYFFFGFGGYSNRMAFISWLFIPILQLNIYSIFNFKLNMALFFLVVFVFSISYLYFVYQFIKYLY